MKQFIRICLLAMVGIVFAVSANAQTFEGIIGMEMYVPQAGPDKIPMEIKSKGDKSVLTMTVPQAGTMSIYTDRVAQKMVMVMAAMNMGYEMDLKKASADAAAAAKPTPPVSAGQKKVINGYNCELYTMQQTDKGVTMELWMTADLPKTLSAAVGRAIGGMNSMNSGGASSADAFDEFVKKGLVMIEFDAKSKGQLMATATFVKYEQKSIADADLTVPAGINVSPMPDRNSMGGQH